MLLYFNSLVLRERSCFSSTGFKERTAVIALFGQRDWTSAHILGIIDSDVHSDVDTDVDSAVNSDVTYVLLRCTQL